MSDTPEQTVEEPTTSTHAESTDVADAVTVKRSPGSSGAENVRKNNRSKDSGSGGGPGGGNFLAILLALVAIGIGSWPAWETWQQKQAAPARQAALDARLEKLTSWQQAVTSELALVQLEVEGIRTDDSTIAAMDTLANQVRADMEAFRNELGSRPKDWLYAEVEYLVRMANQRVLMEGDPVAALQLLESADEIIRDTEGLTAHSLREALATDIAALKTVQTPDVQGIFLELSAQIRQVPALQRDLPQYEPVVSNSPDDAGNEGVMAQGLRLLREAGSRLSSLVDFRRDMNEIKPILPPEEEYYLRQNLMLKLQMAQLALLESDQALYDSALQDADAWIEEHFDPAHGVTLAMRGSLQSLIATPVTRDLPDVSGSLRAARDVLAGWEEKE